MRKCKNAAPIDKQSEQVQELLSELQIVLDKKPWYEDVILIAAIKFMAGVVIDGDNKQDDIDMLDMCHGLIMDEINITHGKTEIN